VDDVGKIHRLTTDGQIPLDNPILPGAVQPSTIWSYGHRNPHGLYFDASERTLYATEHAAPPSGSRPGVSSVVVVP
jgi:glucose/arabinose dehydrogenase